MPHKNILTLLLVIILYGALTAVMLSPAIFSAGQDFIGHPELAPHDVYHVSWSLWWFNKAVVDLHKNPYYTTYLNYPWGRSLYLASISSFHGFASIPLLTVLTVVQTYNFWIIFSFVACGLTMYLLANYIIKDRPAAFVAGVIYSFSTYHLTRGLAHLNHTSMEWLPLYFYFLLRAYREGKVQDYLLAGLVLIINALTLWYYFFYCLLATCLFLLFVTIRDQLKPWRSRFLRKIILIILAVFIILLPLIIPMLQGDKTMFHGIGPSVSADLVSFFIPSGANTWGHHFSTSFNKTLASNQIESATYIGYVALLFLFIHWRKKSKMFFWRLVLILFAVFSLGGSLTLLGVRTVIPMPWRLVQNYFPLPNTFRSPSRFFTIALLALSLLSADGYLITRNWFKKKFSSMSGKTVTGLITTITIFLICLENTAFPYPKIPVNIPEFYRKLANRKGEFAVADVPRRKQYKSQKLLTKIKVPNENQQAIKQTVFMEISLDRLPLFYGTVHEKPIVGINIPRYTKYSLVKVWSTPYLGSLYTKKIYRNDFKASRQFLQNHKIKHVILHDAFFKSFTEKVLASKPTHSEANHNLYEVY